MVIEDEIKKIKSSLNPKELFLSKAFSRYCENIVSGLTKESSHKAEVKVTDRGEEYIAQVSYNKRSHIRMNIGHSFLKRYDIRSEYILLMGLLMHECGHIIWSFDEKIKEHSKRERRSNQILEQGILSFKDTQEIRKVNEILKENQNLREVLCDLFLRLSNCIEDAYIEIKLLKAFPGYKIYLDKLRYVQLKNAKSYEEMKNEDYDEYIIIFNMILRYAKYKVSQDMLTVDKTIMFLQTLYPILDQARLEDSSFLRVEYSAVVTAKVFLYFYQQKQQENKQQAAEKNEDREQEEENQEGDNESTEQSDSGAESKDSNSKSDDTNMEAESDKESGENKESEKPQAENDAEDKQTDETGKCSDEDNSSNENEEEDDIIKNQSDKSESKNDSSDNAEDDNNNADEDNGEPDSQNKNTESEAESEPENSDENTTQEAKNAGKGEEEAEDSEETNQEEMEQAQNDESDGDETTDENGRETESELDGELTMSGSDNSESEMSETDSLEEPDLSQEEIEDIAGHMSDAIKNGDDLSSVENSMENDTENPEMNENLIDDVSTPEGITDAYDMEKEFQKMLPEYIQEKLGQLKEEEIAAENIKLQQSIDFGEANKDVTCRMVRSQDISMEEYEVFHEAVAADVSDLVEYYKERLKDTEIGMRMDGLYLGTRMTNTYRYDLKRFSKERLPEDLPDIQFSVYCDMSGSTSGMRNVAIRKTALMIYEFCQELAIPCMVFGHYEVSPEVVLTSFAEPDSIDGNDGARIASMKVGGCNRDGYGLRYLSEKISRNGHKYNAMFVLSDGLPNAYQYNAVIGKEDIQGVLMEYSPKIKYIVAGIGHDAVRLSDIYRDHLPEEKKATFISITEEESLVDNISDALQQYVRGIFS